jgi:hypothetical protein
MEWLTPLLPATVIAAVALFILKEVVEFFKRWRADGRKRRALRVLLARECELNCLVQTRLTNALTEIQEDLPMKPRDEYLIERRESGEVIYSQRYEGRLTAQFALPAIQTDLMSKVMLDVAILDNFLFAHLQDAYDATMSLKHVRQSLIDFLESDKEEDKIHFEAFPDWALRELARVRLSLQKLYEACTGEKEIKARVR